MAKITALDIADALTGDEELPIVQAKRTKRVTMTSFRAMIVPFLQDWYKGDRGDPGGNVMSIGLFTEAALLLVPVGTDLVQTSGYQAVGRGAARYAYDPAVDAAYAAANPRIAFRSRNGRGFRIAESVTDPLMTGAIGYGAGDDTAAVQAAFDLHRAVRFSILHEVSALTFAGNDTTIDGPGGLIGTRGANARMITVTGNGNIFAFSRAIGFNVAITGSIAGDVLTVEVTDGVIRPQWLANGVTLPGSPLDGEGVTPGTAILDQLTGTPNGPGTYRLTKAQGALGRRSLRSIDREGFFHANDVFYVTGGYNNVLVSLIDGSAGGGVTFIGPRNHLGGAEIRNVYTNSLQVGTKDGNGCSASNCRLSGTISQNNIYATASFGASDNGEWVRDLTFTDMICEFAGDSACELGYHTIDAKVFGGVFRDSVSPPLLLRDCIGAVVMGTTLYANPLALQHANYSLVAVVPQNSGSNFNYAARVQVKALGRTKACCFYVGGRGVDASGSELLAYGDGSPAPTVVSDLSGSGILFAGDIDDFTMIGGSIDGFINNVEWNFDGQPHLRRNIHIRNVKSTRTTQHCSLFNVTPINCSYVNNYGDLPAMREANMVAATLTPTPDNPGVSLQWFGNTFIPGPLSAANPERYNPGSAIADGLLHSSDSAFRRVPSAEYASSIIVSPAVPGTYVAQIVGTTRQILFDVIGTRTIKRAGSDDMNDETGFGLRFWIENGALVAKQYATNAPINQVMKITGPGVAAA